MPMALVMLALVFLFSWSFWIPIYLLADLEPPWKIPLSMIGGLGPAVAAVLTLALYSERRTDRAPTPWVFLIGLVLAFLGFALLRFD